VKPSTIGDFHDAHEFENVDFGDTITVANHETLDLTGLQ
jgi:hypothetical protein